MQPNSIMEEWRDVPGYEGWYSVSNLGRVRSDYAHPGQRAGKVLSPSRGDYPTTQLWRDGQCKGVSVHRLVAAAFIGPCPPGLQVNHKDGNKYNPHVDNLEYVTPSENCLHAIRLGLNKPPQSKLGREHPCSKLTEADVDEIRGLRGIVPQRTLARRFGVHRGTIYGVQVGKWWRHHNSTTSR